MSRLTERFGQNATTKEPCYIPAGIGKQEGNPLNEIINKLGRLEDLADEGRLIELPCKVGDTVWCVTDKYIFVAWVDSFYLTEEDGVLSIEVNLTDVVENDIEIKASSFGRKVFLTKAEAEAKLAELKEGGGDEDL